ncbi:MAG: hypothetical protein ACUVXF_01590 [Desulfobaccales bacterium]
MKRLLLLTVILGLAATSAMAAAVKTYQVTGPVLELTDTMIAVQKGKDRWELARTPETKVTGDLKVGAKVTIEYRMNATQVEVKDKAKEAPKKK